ncbi:MAG: hypothetical protein J6W81_01675 [Lentisphaeria bacterium]|nr:hypothetical protein [Lentisphaeria bacterium]
MYKNVYLNVIMTLFLIIFVVMGIVLVTALDRQRFVLEEQNMKLASLEARLNMLSQQDFSLSAAKKETAETAGKTLPAANAEYFDRNAVSGGRLISAFSADVGNMNLLISNDAYVSQIWSDATDSLAERNYNDRGDGQYEPMLAESWQISPDHLKIRIKLRKGILWHDFKDPVSGKEWRNQEVTAYDFKFYVDVIKNPDVDCAPLRGYLKDMEKIVVINDHEFDVVWNKPYFMMEDITLGLTPLPRHLYHAYEGPFDGKKFNDDHVRNRMLVGCGPYRFERWDKGRRILLRRFENYFGRNLGIMPPLETIAYDIIQHPNTRLQSLLSRDLDMISLTADQWVNRTSSPEFGEKGFLKKFQAAGSSYNYIGLNLKTPVLKDKRVRQALSHLVNLERLRKEIFFDLVDPVSGPFPRNSSAYDHSVKPYSFDPGKAKALLREAGWKEGTDGILEKAGQKLTFTVIYPNTAVSYQKVLSVVKEDMKKAGVRLDLLGIEWSVLVQRLENKQFEACMLGWSGTLKPDPYQLWHSSHKDQPKSSNMIGFSNPEADSLIEQIRVCFDPEKRNQLYHRFHRLIHDEAPYIFLFSPQVLSVVNSRYQNVRQIQSRIPTRPMWVQPSQQMRVP